MIKALDVRIEERRYYPPLHTHSLTSPAIYSLAQILGGMSEKPAKRAMFVHLPQNPGQMVGGGEGLLVEAFLG